MAERVLVSRYTGRITSVKVLPFKDSGFPVKYEITQIAQLASELSGNIVGRNLKASR